MARTGRSSERTTPTPEEKSAARAPRGGGEAALFDRVRAYVGFEERDSALLADFFPKVEPHIPEIVEDFYARLLRDPVASRVLTGGPAQIARLKESLRMWLERALKGPHDAEFARQQAQIGAVHVRVGLEQSFMVTGTHVFREHLDRILVREHPQRTPRSSSTRLAFVRLLDMALALMMETYREEYLRRLLQTEQNATFRRLAALGEVAASIAHEIRNPLAGISGAIQILSREAKPDDPRREILQEILREVSRLDERVNDLLLYARPSPIQREIVRPDEFLKATVRLLAEDPMFRKARVTTRSARGLRPFPLDKGQVQQVIVNLVLNALQAMNGTGEIRLSARPADRGALEIVVEDDGPGVPAELAEEIFRPFFTTRRQGTGLGLAISRKIAESHGGSLQVERARSGGARFTLLLPTLPEETAPHPAVR